MSLFSDSPRPALVGMIHVPALPGAPRHESSMADILAAVADEAEVYADAGVDGVILENMHDVPYLRGAVGPEITAAMTAVAARTGEIFPGPVGVQVLAGANREALAVALAAGLQFVRVEGFVFGHVADEGWLDACAGPLLRYRREIGAGHVQVLADIKKKHAAHAATADVSLAETAAAAAFAGADGVIVTGVATGAVAAADDVTTARAACGLPVLVGSGVTADNLADYAAADAVIVGSHLKADGHWRGALDADRVAALVAARDALGGGAS
jgi:membrane complex biogenesis BtpA family protein